jgi:hypothetical protein
MLVLTLVLGAGLSVGMSSALAQQPEALPPEPAMRSSADAAGTDTGVGSRPLSESLSGAAKTDYDAGVILFEEQDFSGAFIKFQQAFEASADIRLLWNMAVCQKSLHHYTQVQRLIERYEREGQGHMTGEHRAEVLEVLDMIRTLISSVRILVEEPGTQIYIDGEFVGTTPLAEPLKVDLGKRQIRVSKDGFEERVIDYEFTGGSTTTLNVGLVAKPRDGALEIISLSGATIRIDGRIVGTERWKGNLLAGTHSVRVSARDKRSADRDVVIDAGQPLRTLYISLDAVESSVPGWVWVGAGVVAAGGLAAGGYFVFKPSAKPFEPTNGTLPPGSVQL